MSRIDWTDVLDVAAAIVARYTDTSVTLRQLFYALVSTLMIPNSQTAYKTLSARTAEARRQGTFPELIDRERTIHRPATFDDRWDGLKFLRDIYRHDRTEGQPYSIFLGVEKVGIVEQLKRWFGDPLGIPIVALRGYSSQTYVDDIAADVERQQRPAVLLYAGDFDPSGEDIVRDFAERTDCWSKIERVALTSAQVDHYDLPPQPGKATDSRAAGFVERHGRLVQVELDALPPETLRGLYAEALDYYWDTSAFEFAVRREDAERAALARIIDNTRTGS